MLFKIHVLKNFAIFTEKRLVGVSFDEDKEHYNSHVLHNMSQTASWKIEIVFQAYLKLT